MSKIHIYKKKKIYFLYDMIRTRIIEERIAKEYSLGEIRCPIHLSIGQEAIATGVCKSLTKKDYIFSSHRSHAHYLSKNGSVEKFICEIFLI